MGFNTNHEQGPRPMRFYSFRYTNFTPNNYGVVLMQQGRVIVDADWNE